MKITYFLVLVFCITSIVACSQDQSAEDQIKLSKIKKLQSDNDYWALMKAKAEVKSILLYNDVDMDSIDKLDFSSYSSFCEIDKSIVENIRGGFEYLNLNCLIDTKRKIVYERYASLIESLSKEERITLLHDPAKVEIDYNYLIEKNRQ